MQVENPGGSTWAVRGNRTSVLATTTYGTARATAIDLVQAVLEQRQIRIFDELEDGTRVLNLTETVAAQEKAGEIGERFTDWMWADPDRATTLARRYNDRFNSIVLRSYDAASKDFRGLALTFTPRPHQVAAVARIVSEPAVLLAHEVGAGKTAEMVLGAMELRRLGMATKPPSWCRTTCSSSSPASGCSSTRQAKVLAAGTEDLAGDKRRLFLARVATGDWDGVILSRSAFERVPLSRVRSRPTWTGNSTSCATSSPAPARPAG